MNIGRAIQLSRQQRGESQRRVARRAGVSVSYLSMIENNRREPPLAMIARIAAAMDVPLALLLMRTIDRADLSPLSATAVDQVLGHLRSAMQIGEADPGLAVRPALA